MLNISTPALESFLAAGRQCEAAGQYQQAEANFRKALQLSPSNVDALRHLGVLYQNLGRFPEALELYQKILAIQPSDAAALNNSGVVLQRFGNTEQAIAAYQQFLRYYPNNAAVCSNLGTALQDCGRIDEALVSLRRAIRLDPNMLAANSALLIILQYHPNYDARAIYEESRRWNDTVVKRLAQPFTSHANDRNPDRRLRIGYFSPDLRDHSVGRFMEPILANHDRGNFEIFCYAQNPPDIFTNKLQHHPATWRFVMAHSDSDLANLIRQDKIDILIDLAMHTHGGRPLVFARKPAPVQAIYLAYAGTTGLTAIDYRLSDPYLDPPGTDESVYSEKTLRLPQTYWCYESPPDAPPPGPLAASTNGYITFGCLNNYAKINDAVLEAWATLLAFVPHSHLLLFCPQGDHRPRVLAILTRHGVSADRIEFFTRGPYLQYFQAYHRIDIALDSFPYCGGTTTCDALWMGVPVITLSGNKPVARAGASILANAGLSNLVANSTQDYLRIAADLAADLPRLADLRRTLRSQMQSSPLMNTPTFTRQLESAYRQMWQAWCATH